MNAVDLCVSWHNCAVSTAPLSSSGTPAPASNMSVVQLIQFTVPYQLSQITDTVRKNMALAIAEIIGVDVTMIFLSFTTVSRRSRGLLQANEVLVTAPLSRALSPLRGPQPPRASAPSLIILRTGGTAPSGVAWPCCAGADRWLIEA